MLPSPILPNMLSRTSNMRIEKTRLSLLYASAIMRSHVVGSPVFLRFNSPRYLGSNSDRSSSNNNNNNSSNTAGNRNVENASKRTVNASDRFTREIGPIEINSNKRNAASLLTSRISVQPVYVHPLSQIVLLYLQTHHHQWVTKHCLDQHLSLHRDGTFVIQYGAVNSCNNNNINENNKIGSVYDNNNNNNNSTINNSNTRIWTYYDVVYKQHWLSLQHGPVQHRFLLQDFRMPTWQKGKSLPERIHQAVDELMEALDELEE